MSICDTCGSYGHKAGSRRCPYRRAELNRLGAIPGRRPTQEEEIAASQRAARRAFAAMFQNSGAVSVPRQGPITRVN